MCSSVTAFGLPHPYNMATCILAIPFVTWLFGCNATPKEAMVNISASTARRNERKVTTSTTTPAPTTSTITTTTTTTTSSILVFC